MITVVIIRDSLLYKSTVDDSFLSLVFDWLWILPVCLQFLFNRGLFLLIASLKLKNSPTKWQSPPQNSRVKSLFFRKLTSSSASVLDILSHSFLFCLVISSSLSLEFTLTLCVLFLCLSVSPRNNSKKAFSRWMRVLSHSDTHYLNRHMAQCGCHERSGQPGSSQGYMACCGCHQILIAICHTQEVFCPDQKKSQGNRSFLPRW